MRKTNISFSSARVPFYFDGSVKKMLSLVDKRNSVIITDENVLAYHGSKLKGWKMIVIAAGEEHKQLNSIDAIIRQLMDLKANRSTTLIGIGGGTVTDITGFVGSIYMRGIATAFVPTTVLAMVDAAIGGKNGVNFGIYKNILGIVRQPAFLLYDYSLLSSLPADEWKNGFAEIIKHACILDPGLFRMLEKNNIAHYQRDNSQLDRLIKRNVMLKSSVVQRDEFEKGERKLLNFGHTLGHAIENNYNIHHGKAVAIGMAAACAFSARLTGFGETGRVVQLIEQYGLPVRFAYDAKEAFETMTVDKKASGKTINYVLLEAIGKGIIYPLELRKLNQLLGKLTSV